jgi:hypothetical protein
MLWKALLVGVMLCSGLTGTLAAFAAGPFFAPEPPATPGEPFSAVAQTQSTTVFHDGNRIVRTNTVHYFRDAQGRTRVERDSPPFAAMSAVKAGGTGSNRIVAAANSVIVIDDPASGERINLIPQMKIATVFKLPQGDTHVQMLSHVSQLEMAPFGLLGLGMGLGANGMTTESSADTTSLGEKVVNGVLAAGTRVVRTIPAGALGNEKPITSTLEEWTSAELGMPVQITEQSSIGGDLRFNLQDVVRAEPDPALFTVPSDYTRHDINGPMSVVSGTAPNTAVLKAVKQP